MPHTAIILTEINGFLVPSQPSVAVVAGDTVTFTIARAPSATLFFSQDAVSVLSPSPGPSMQLGAGNQAAFSFTSSEPGAYGVVFTAGRPSHPPHFTQVESNLLLLDSMINPVGGQSFGGPTNTPQTGG
jgi:hypothetical protein